MYRKLVEYFDEKWRCTEKYTMPLTKSLKVSKNPELMQYFSVDEDPEAIFTDQREIGHGSFGAVYYVSEQSFVVPN